MAVEGVTAFHQFGIRGINNITADAPLEKQRIYWIGQTREIAAGASPLDLPDDAPYYVTLDIDVLDPSEAPGTTTPVPGGLRYPELIALIDRVLHGRRVVGVDLVEIDPERDVNNVTTHIGVELLLLLLNYLGHGPDISGAAEHATAY
jgi:agmatinase